MPSILIVGINSTIGRALKIEFEENGWLVYGTTRQSTELTNQKIFFLDLEKTDSFSLPENIFIDVVLLSASVTSIKFCCENPSLCTTINYDAQMYLIDYLKNRFNPFFIFLSSNAVFDGDKSFRGELEKPCPVNLYGKLKADVEKKILTITDSYAILRATKILYPEQPLIKKWIEDLKSGGIIYPISDLMVCPISLKNMLTAISLLAKKRVVGIYHLSGETDISYVDIATYMAKIIGTSERLIEKITTKTISILPGYAPKYTSLDMTRTQNNLSIFPENYKDVLHTFLNFQKC